MNGENRELIKLNKKVNKENKGDFDLICRAVSESETSSQIQLDMRLKVGRNETIFSPNCFCNLVNMIR